MKVAGTDGKQVWLGVPSVTLPMAFGLATPALTIYSQMIQEGRVDMEVLIYAANAGKKEKIPSLKGNSYYKKYTIFFVPYTRKDIP